MYNILSRKFLKNMVTIIMIVCQQNVPDEVIKSIGTFYKVLTRDNIKEFVIYDNSIENADLLKYLDNLPNINNKFNIVHSQGQLNVANIKRELFAKVNDGIICYINNPVLLVSEKLFDLVADYLYDESLGMIGFSGGYLTKLVRSDPINHIDKCDKSTVVDYISGCQFFRSELKYYNIRIDSTTPLSDLDLSLQIRNIGKTLLIMPYKHLIDNYKGETFNNVAKDVWSRLLSKWSKLATVK